MTNIIQPSILPGFMELLPEDQVLFNQMKNTIEQNFKLYGFWPLDTPAIEKADILLAKGGGETSKQIYRIERADHSQDQALRFDLTVPLARYVAQHSYELSFPFRRYQIAKVYRGERSQKGRYREFYQCDIDIVGRDHLSLINDAEIPAVINKIFQKFALAKPIFHINHRGLLNGFFASLGISDSTEVLRAIDKLDKIGKEGVQELLEDENLSSEQIHSIFDFLSIQGTNEEKLKELGEMAEKNDLKEEFVQGLSELKEVYAHMIAFGIGEDRIDVDLSICRGLDYYTGMVYETFLEGYEGIGSVCSGGRYDNLASNFTKEKLPGVGLSIGLTRLFYQLRTADLIRPEKGDYLAVLVMPMSNEDLDYSIKVINAFREVGIISQLYTEKAKMKKKFSYADSIGARYALIIGESERKESKVSIKDLSSGIQKAMSLNEAIDLVQEN